MPLTSLKEILDPAFEERYGVAAINIVNDLSVEAVLAAATELDSPVILQTSLKTVKQVGAKVLYELIRLRADETPVPVALHLDHCPEREWVTTCLRTGWSSVLFDGSHLDVEENTRQTAEVVEEARALGAHVEGEIESVLGVEDDIGSDEAGEIHPIAVSSQFIEDTGVYAFAPAGGDGAWPLRG
jgi:fructose-bisphosphate aldolase class II